MAGTSALGVRPDLAAKTRDLAFLLENAALLCVFLLAAKSAFQLSVPDDIRSLWTYAQPVLGLSLALGLVLLRGHSGSLDAPGVPLHHGRACLWRSAGLGALPVLVGWALLRRAAPQERRWVGLLLALSAFSLSTLGTQALCGNDAAPHLLRWHYLPLLLAGLAGAALGEVAFHKRVSWPRAR